MTKNKDNLNWAEQRKNILDIVEKYPTQIENAVDSAYLAGLEVSKDLLSQRETELDINIGMLRQWLNEDRITDNKKMVTNEDIHHWLDINQKDTITNLTNKDE